MRALTMAVIAVVLAGCRSREPEPVREKKSAAEMAKFLETVTIGEPFADVWTKMEAFADSPPDDRPVLSATDSDNHIHIFYFDKSKKLTQVMRFTVQDGAVVGDSVFELPKERAGQVVRRK